MAEEVNKNSLEDRSSKLTETAGAKTTNGHLMPYVEMMVNTESVIAV